MDAPAPIWEQPPAVSSTLIVVRPRYVPHGKYYWSRPPADKRPGDAHGFRGIWTLTFCAGDDAPAVEHTRAGEDVSVPANTWRIAAHYEGGRANPVVMDVGLGQPRAVEQLRLELAPGAEPPTTRTEFNEAPRFVRIVPRSAVLAEQQEEAPAL